MGAHHEARLLRLPVHTNSSLTTFRRCPREYWFKYVLNRKSRRKAAALRFGSLFHVGLNAWWTWHWKDSPSSSSLLGATFEALHKSAEIEGTDAFDLVKAEMLLAGYSARWGDAGYQTIAVEKQFRIPGESGPLPDFVLCGSIDAIVMGTLDVLHNVEHKTTSSDISVGSDYWRHVDTMDPQVSTYFAAAKAMGYDVRDTLYDVIRKPTLLPLKATPPDSLKYTKPTKKEPIPRLYAGQRETDETPEEYGERLAEDIASRPDWYYARRTIVRLEHDDAEHARDVAMTAAAIQFATEREAWPRTPTACERYGRLCDFHDVCSGLTTIDDGTRYVTKTRQHEELADGT